MYMPYTTNPHMPRVRAEAAKLVVDEGWSTRKVARHTGFNQSTIVRWSSLYRKNSYNRGIPTLSSRPHSHPRKLSTELVQGILEYRKKYRRGAEFIHHFMKRDGHKISLSSVKRTLRREGLTKYSKWKKWHKYTERPKPEKPGILMQLDTIVDGPHTDRLYVYTMIDVCSRWAFAMPVRSINNVESWRFVDASTKNTPFELRLIQTDHGSEYAKHFKKQLKAHRIEHRHSRVRTPTDNAFVERFNRTIQEECMLRGPKTFSAYKKAIPEYLHFYNNERPHMGINMQTPNEVMQSY